MNLSFLKHKEVKNAGWIIGARVVQMLLSLLVSILSARLLGPSNYGLVKNPVCCLTIQSKLCEWRTEVSRDEGGANRADFSLRSETYRMDNNPQRY